MQLTANTPIQGTHPQLPALLSSFPPSPSPGNIGQHYGFGDVLTLGEGLGRLVIPIFSIATALVVIYFLIGAFKYLTAGEDKDATVAAREMITHAIIGFALLMFVFLVMQFLPQVFGFKLPALL